MHFNLNQVKEVSLSVYIILIFSLPSLLVPRLNVNLFNGHCTHESFEQSNVNPKYKLKFLVLLIQVEVAVKPKKLIIKHLFSQNIWRLI